MPKFENTQRPKKFELRQMFFSWASKREMIKRKKLKTLLGNKT